MKLFADENVARAIVSRLREWGNDVLHASEIQPGAVDTEWLTLAEADARLILTSD
jgi:predicted nuclease of predicted toxin-antitoxin system